MNLKSLKGLARDWLVAIVVVVGIWIVWVQFFAPSPKTEGPAPDFALANLAGEEIRLSALTDDVVVLNFWFTDCPPCVHEIPELSAFHKAHPDIPIFGVSVDRKPTRTVGVLSKKLGIAYPVLHDPKSHVARLYGVSVFPTTVVIHEGEIAAVRTGEVTQASLERLIEVH